MHLVISEIIQPNIPTINLVSQTNHMHSAAIMVRTQHLIID